MRVLFRLFSFLFLFCPGVSIASPVVGISMHGSPSLTGDFGHLPYARPDAPKGGVLRYGVIGTFDSLNPFILKSIRTTARGIWDSQFGNLVFESLLRRTRDESFTLYGLLAESVELPDHRRWIEFHLNPRARFSDGVAVKVEDVLFTFDLLGERGRPPYSSRMGFVSRMERTGERSIKIHFTDSANRETPLLFGMMPILPSHLVDPETFDRSTLEAPIGSGPYTVSDIRPGERITFTRNKNYWGVAEPINLGFFNFDEIRIEYFANTNAQFEALKKGLYDIHIEGNTAKWATSYNFPAITEGRLIKETFDITTPSGMLGFVFNTRRSVFMNRNVRKALSLAFDFEWANENLFHGAFTRTSSYWQNSHLSFLDNPADDWEQSFFSAYPNLIDESIMTGTYRAPTSDGTGRDRRNLRQALSILESEGYRLSDGKLLDSTGAPLRFEVLIGSGGQDIERLVLSYKDTLSRLGISLEPRFVDDSQFQSRKTNFDYDMIIARYSSSLSPGVEQKFRWGSQSRDTLGSFNYAGAGSEAIDGLIDALINARGKDEFTRCVRALDRALISGHYVIPLYHSGESRIARSANLSRPPLTPLYGPRFSTWWCSDDCDQ